MNFSYPGTIISTKKDKVFICVSIEGKDVVIKTPYQSFDFDIKPDMQIMVEGIVKDGTKQLIFRKTTPIIFNDKQEELLKRFVNKL